MPIEPGRYHGFRIEYHDEVAVVTLSSPERKNALDLRTKRELTELIFQLNLDGHTRALVFVGDGHTFCAGDDVAGAPLESNDHRHIAGDMLPYSRQPAHTYRAIRSVTQNLMRTLIESDLPTVAAIDGFAIQSGLTLALCCDIRVASAGARLASGTLRFGMQPDEGGHHLLVQYMGLARAMTFVLLSEFLSAEQAASAGLVSEVVEAGTSFERALAIAETLARGPATALRLAKRSLRRAAESTLEQSFETIALSAAISDYDADMHEGLQSFRAKRQPSFRRFDQTEQGASQANRSDT